jgi:7-cyano-7-deazaguanine tRNA-ribosyltransferase
LSFEIKDKELAGRIGKLMTRSGSIETPAFFPVVNPFRKGDEVPTEKIRDMGFTQIITNAYIIMQRLGEKGAELGVHRITGFDGVVMTDSGAYQLLMYGHGKVKIDPLKIVEYQIELGSDIAVIADIPTRDNSTYSEAEESVIETLRRAQLSEPLIRGDERIWVLPIQGGIHYDLVRRSAEEGSKLPSFAMYAIGSPVTVLEKYGFRKVVKMVATAKKVLPPDKPVHLFGGGHPMIIPLMVALGVDTFDSASYILYAREGRYMTEGGTYRLNDLDYLPCECEVCSRYTPKELIELDPPERTRLLAIHNLHVIRKVLKETKEAIREGRLWELIEKASMAHPSIREAFMEVLRYADWIEELDPRYKGKARGMFLYDAPSYYRPELLRHRSYLKREYRMVGGNVVLLPGDFSDKPFRNSEIFRRAMRKGLIGETTDVIIYLPFFNYLPLDLDQTYPYAQFEAPSTVPQEILGKMINALTELVGKALAQGKRVRVCVCKELPWGDPSVLRPLLQKGVEVIDLCKDVSLRNASS